MTSIYDIPYEDIQIFLKLITEIPKIKTMIMKLLRIY